MQIILRMHRIVHDEKQKKAAATAASHTECKQRLPGAHAHLGAAQNASCAPSDLPPSVTVDSYLQGHVLRMAMIQFESATTEFVKHKMQEKYPGMHPANCAGIPCPASTGLMSRGCGHHGAHQPPPPISLWLHKCREAAPVQERQNMMQVGTWSALALASVFNKYMADVFAASFGIADVHEAKELAVHVFQAMYQRSQRTHTTVLNTSPHDVLSTLQRLCTIALRCHDADAGKVCATAIDRLQHLVDEAEGCVLTVCVCPCDYLVDVCCGSEW